ncbi:MAG: hybrid sensor histidine kinase/response regulator [Magnetococcus sp. MYC-9]
MESTEGASRSSAMIEDQELRELFAAESEEHLHQLESGLLHMEKNPSDVDMLKELFREAHSLKGAARMLGVRDVEALAHHFEDFLGAASKGQRSFTSLDVDRLTRSLDDIRALVDEAVTGKMAAVTLPEALRRLTHPEEAASAARPAGASPERSGESLPPSAALAPSVGPARPAFDPPPPDPPPPLPSREQPPPLSKTQVAEPLTLSMAPVAPAAPAAVPVAEPVRNFVAPAVPAAAPEVSVAPVVSAAPPLSAAPLAPTLPASAAASPAAVDAPAAEGGDAFTGGEETAPVIRVRSNKLDALLRMVGELTVVRTRVKRRLSEIEELLATWEETHGELIGGDEPVKGTLDQTGRCFLQREQFGSRLLLLRHGIAEDETALELVAESLEEGIRNLRLLPLSTLFGLFPRLVRDLARQQEKEVVLVTEGGETAADKRILEEMKSPLMHLIRNAVDHGLERTEVREKAGKPRAGTLSLRALQTATHVVLEIRDDGRGLDLEAIRRQARKRGLYTEENLASLTAEQLYPIIFQSGFSTSALVTDVSGRGVGLDVVRAQVERLKGRIQVRSTPGRGCCFTISLPVTLATTPVFIATANGESFAMPLDAVHSVRRVVPEEIFPIEGCDTIVVNDRPVSVAHLAHLLELPESLEGMRPPPWPCILLNLGEDGWLGVICDTLEDELEVVLKPFGGLLQRVRNLSGTTILGSGKVCLVVNPQDLLLTVRKRGRQLSGLIVGASGSSTRPGAVALPSTQRKKTILLAEDSLTTRTQEKRILQAAGYEVIAAVDGLDALNRLGKQPIDAVVSDVQMPNLDGLSLTEKIRQNPLYKDLPLILVTSLSSDEDMRRGMEVGANAYITKPTFEQKIFLETLQRLV